MSAKYLFAPLLIFAVSAGCTMDRTSSPNVMTVPPYLQSQNQLAQTQLAEMRVFHEKETSKMSEDMHIFQNREIERLAATGKELESRPPENPPTTHVQQGKWTNWFKKKNKDDAPLVSEASKNVR